MFCRHWYSFPQICDCNKEEHCAIDISPNIHCAARLTPKNSIVEQFSLTRAAHPPLPQHVCCLIVVCEYLKRQTSLGKDTTGGARVTSALRCYLGTRIP